ncbi:MAG: acyltransferase [Gammaproteobacteria bacterium]|nr:acyltransferase [Gammaproteobacteria bacterium]
MNTAKTRLPAMDMLRFAAAMGVLAYHYLSSYLPEDAGKPWLALAAHITRYGYLGVELFFIISGFVILWSAQGKSATSFAVSRFCRLYPTFWAAMLLTSACYLLLGPHAPQMSGQEISLHRLLANATMMPQLFNAERIDGVYWTLELEIRFYFLVFVLLLLRQIGNIERWLYAWLAACTWITLQGAPRWIEFFAVAPYGSFFIGGCLLYLIHSAGWTWQRAVALGIAIALSVADSLRIRSGFITADAESAWAVPLLVLLLFGVLLLLLVFLHRPDRLTPQSGLSYRLGALTYPLYLTHAAIGRMLIEILLPHVGAVWAVLMTSICALVIAQLLVVLVDEPARKPAARLLYRGLDLVGTRLGAGKTSGKA